MILSFIWTALNGAAEPEMFDAALVRRVLMDCEAEPAPWTPGKTVIENRGQDHGWELKLWDPGLLIAKTLSYTNNGWRGRQYPDLNTSVPGDYPRRHKLQYTLLNFRRQSEDGHWVAADRSGMNVLYNPDENLDIDWWGRSGKWRGVQVWHV